MKHLLRRSAAALGMAAMVLLTACGGPGSPASSGSDVDINPDDLKSVLNQSPDFGKSASMYDDIKGTKLTLSFFEEPKEGSVTRKVLDAFEEKYEVEVEEKLYNWNEWQTRIFQMVSSGTAPDNVWMGDTNFLAFMARNVIQPIDQWVDFTDPVWNQGNADFFTWEGQHYAMTPSTDIGVYFIYYNKELFEDLNVEDPRTMYEEGRWDFAALREAAKRFVADTDGDNIQDRFGFACWNSDIFSLANGGKGLEITEDGRLQATITGKKEQAGYQMYQDMFYVDKSISADMTDPNTAMANGKLAMLAERPWNAMGNFDMYNMCDFEIGVVPFPSGPDTEGKRVVPATLTGMGIAVGAQNPKAAAAFYHFKEMWINENYRDQAYVNEVGTTYKTFENYKWHLDFVNDPDTVMNASHLYGLPSWWEKRAPLVLDIMAGVPIATCTQSHIGLVQDGINAIEKALADKK